MFVKIREHKERNKICVQFWGGGSGETQEESPLQ